MPDPGVLDRGTWVRETLKSMAPWLGLSRLNYDRLPDGAVLREAHVFPDEPVFSLPEWRSVTEFFYSNAPAGPPAQSPRPAVQVGVPGFRVESWQLGTQLPFSTLVRIDPVRKTLWHGDGQDRSFRSVDSMGKIRWRLPVPSGPVDLVDLGDALWVTLIGRVFPSDELAGQIWNVPLTGNPQDATRILGELRRPVRAAALDLDQNGTRDLVVSAFGNRLGNLSWFKGRPGGGFEEQVLQEYPGTLQALPMDWNRDGRQDLLVVRAQAREGLTVLLNDGLGSFTPKVILELPPTFGLVGLELADMDGDGREEFVLVNGDSGDYASPHKFFHGVRIFARVAEDRLEERYFFPMYGAYGVRARDFDGDGDRDLAMISFFPDFEAAPSESFVYLRNDGGGRFTPFAMAPEDATRGRWLVMDAGDLDGDGDEDIALGSFFRGPPTIPIPDALVRRWESERVSVMVLRNQSRP